MGTARNLVFAESRSATTKPSYERITSWGDAACVVGVLSVCAIIGFLLTALLFISKLWSSRFVFWKQTHIHAVVPKKSGLLTAANDN